MSTRTVERTVADMTVADLKTLIRDTIEEVLLEMLCDPDLGLELRPEFEQRLQKAMAYMEAGGKTLSLEEMTARLEAE